MILKLILLFTLLANITYAKRLTMDLSILHNGYYTKNTDNGTIAFNVYPDKTVYFFTNDFPKKNHPYYTLYTDSRDVTFLLLTEGLIYILKNIQFINSEYIYFVWFDKVKKNIYNDIVLRIDIQKLSKLNNRDFGRQDEQLCKSSDIGKYKLYPIRTFLKTISIYNLHKNQLVKSSELTNSYKKFIDQYTFTSIGKFEFDIENNQQKIESLKKDIHHHCLNGDYEKVKLYVNLNFDINKKDSENKQTLLEYASVRGHYNIVKLLIDNGANPNIHKKGSENAYLSAKGQGFKRIAKLLKPITTMIERPKTSSSLTNNAEQMCQEAVVASGRDQGYSIGYCRNTLYSASKWVCVAKHTFSGESVNFGIGACSSY